MASEGSAGPAGPKSRQERIRDNQRRSRARRQEYLTELERRLSESRTTCREAELQRAAFLDLQAEVVRLRELLNVAGVSPEVVDNFGRHALPPRPADVAPGPLRQIKPKFQASDAFDLLDRPGGPMALHDANGLLYGHVSPASSSHASYSAMSADAYPMYDAQYRYPPVVPDADGVMAAMSRVNHVSPLPVYDWVYRSEAAASNSSADSAFSAVSFPPSRAAALQPDDPGAGMVSMARSLNDHYQPSPVDMEEIKARLATGYTRPTFSKPGPWINGQTAFDGLSELQVKHPRS